MSISTQKKSLIAAKFKAGFIHFLISFSIFLVVVLWVRFFAHPSVYFSMAGAVQGLTIVLLVDVVLGPLLSFLVYNPAKSKKETISDFSIIGAVQIAALVYGVHTLYQERPRALIIYPNSTATVITHRELVDFPELGDLGQYTKIEGLPAAVLLADENSISYRTLEQSKTVIAETDAATRRFVRTLPEVEAELSHIDSTYNQPYVFAVMAKYNGAYFALDKDLNFLTKFSEKPVS